MKRLTVLLLLFGSFNVHAGTMIYNTFYIKHDLVQGKGLTHANAISDARSAIPDGYIEDPKNSMTYECTESNAYFADTGVAECDISVPENVYLVTMPVVRNKN